MRRLIIVMSILFLYCGFVYASVDSVSGNIISGSTFGVKSPAEPYLWADFETDLSPSNLGVVSSWDAVDSIEWDSDEGTNNSGCAKSVGEAPWTASVNADGFAWNDYDQKCYVYRKIKENFDILNYYGEGSPINWKEWRVWCASDEVNVKVNSLIGVYNGSVITEELTYPNGSPSGNPAIMVGTPNQFNTKEFWYQSNSIAENLTTSIGDGTFEIFVNGVNGLSVPYEAYNGWRYWKNRESDSGDQTVFYAIHGVEANETFISGETYWVDDLYVDTTWARVMACNASTMAASTHREIQIPSAWSDNSITVTYNQGTFADYETAYLVVIDADGSEVGSIEGYFLDNTFYPSGTGPVASASSISGAYSITGACNLT